MGSFVIMYVIICHQLWRHSAKQSVELLNCICNKKKIHFFVMKLTFISSHEAKHVYLIGGFATHVI